MEDKCKLIWWHCNKLSSFYPHKQMFKTNFNRGFTGYVLILSTNNYCLFGRNFKSLLFCGTMKYSSEINMWQMTRGNIIRKTLQVSLLCFSNCFFVFSPKLAPVDFTRTQSAGRDLYIWNLFGGQGLTLTPRNELAKIVLSVFDVL